MQENKKPTTKFEQSEYRLTLFKDEEEKSIVSSIQHKIAEKPKKRRKKSRSKSKDKRADSNHSNGSTEEKKKSEAETEQKFKFPKKPNKHSTQAEIDHYYSVRKDYINNAMPGVQTQFCNFGHKYDTIKNIHELMRFDFINSEKKLKNLTPLKIRVECTIYHGCDELLEKGKAKQVSKEMYFS